MKSGDARVALIGFPSVGKVVLCFIHCKFLYAQSPRYVSVINAVINDLVLPDSVDVIEYVDENSQ